MELRPILDAILALHTGRMVPGAATAQTGEAVVNPHNLPRPTPVGERFYRTEWMGTPPDIAAQWRLQQVMETPPEYQRHGWSRARYAKL